MFINISINGIKLFTEDNYIYLKQNNLEYEFPKILKEYYKPIYKNIYIINGPWSFTNLRIWTLTLNTLNFIQNFKLNFYNIGKINFFKYFVEQNILPSKGIIFIWQKKNAWLYNFKENGYQIIKYDQIKNIKDDFFIDDIEDFTHANKIQINYKQDQIIITFKNQNYKLSSEDFKKISQKTHILKPNYLIQPNICL